MTQVLANSYVGIDGRNESFGTSTPNTDYTIDARDGSDIVIAYDGSDYLIGGLGIDLVIGDLGDDVIFGDRFWNDYATSANQNLAARADLLIGDRYDGSAVGGRDIIFAGGGNNYVNGGSANDYIVGGNGREFLQGGTGDDTIFGYSGDDRLYGGTGLQSAQASFVARNIGPDIQVNFNGFNDAVLAQQYTLSGYLGGVALTDTGSDTLDGGSGNDSINGGDGADTMKGGSGRDRFSFDADLGPANVDHIGDFAQGSDTIMLENRVFKGLSSGGSEIAEKAFKDIADAARDSNDRILYNHNTGRLYYDADGSGSKAGVLFAILDNKPQLTHHDFDVV